MVNLSHLDKYISSYWQHLISFIREHEGYSIQFFGAFSATILAFSSFFGRIVKRKRDRKAIVENEHAHLERYLAEVSHILDGNDKLLSAIIKGYKERAIDPMLSLREILIREDISMNIEDLIFINRIGILISELKYLNFGIVAANKLIVKINDEIDSDSPQRSKRARDLSESFSKNGEKLGGMFRLYKDIIQGFIAENRVLLKQSKNWSLNKNTLQKEYEIRKQSIASELELMSKEKAESPLWRDYIEKFTNGGI